MKTENVRVVDAAISVRPFGSGFRVDCCQGFDRAFGDFERYPEALEAAANVIEAWAEGMRACARAAARREAA